MSAFVMEAIRWSGLTAADGEKSSGGRMELPRGELAELPADMPGHSTFVIRNQHNVTNKHNNWHL